MLITRHAHQGLLAGIAVLALAAWTGPAAALECPEPQTVASAGVLKEPEKEIKELSQFLAGGVTDNRISELVSTMRSRYPSADNAALVNFFVTAYCPVVKAEDLSEDAAKSKIEAFSSEVYGILNR